MRRHRACISGARFFLVEGGCTPGTPETPEMFLVQQENTHSFTHAPVYGVGQTTPDSRESRECMPHAVARSVEIGAYLGRTPGVQAPTPGAHRGWAMDARSSWLNPSQRPPPPEWTIHPLPASSPRT